MDDASASTSASSPPPGWLEAARAHWTWRGQARPAFAQSPGPGRISVWDSPRPPRIEPESREILIRRGDREVARTRDAVRVLETAHPPVFYLPWDAVDRSLLRPQRSDASFCEWKGAARYWSLVDGAHRLEGVAWDYPAPGPGAEALAGRIAFYPRDLDCRVDGVPVRPQPGGFYGGWITPELAGPFKGEPGSEHW